MSCEHNEIITDNRARLVADIITISASIGLVGLLFYQAVSRNDGFHGPPGFRQEYQIQRELNSK